ncbi:MAG: Smr/MutS family protein [Verrucomicrobia bacterium]|nr:Smr/MutS family protein [Verrucomicrobiota bacterium]
MHTDPQELPINGVLDLHTFQPRDVKDLVPTYLEECRRLHIYDVRIIHGKGIGALRETVHSILRKLPMVASFALAPGNAGGWGATCVRLRPEEAPATDAVEPV